MNLKKIQKMLIHMCHNYDDDHLLGQFYYLKTLHQYVGDISSLVRYQTKTCTCIVLLIIQFHK